MPTTRIALWEPSDTGVPMIITEGDAAVTVCPLMITGAGTLVLGEELDEDVGEKRDGPRKVGGDKVDGVPVVGASAFVRPPTFCSVDIESLGLLACSVTTIVIYV